MNTLRALLTVVYPVQLFVGSWFRDLSISQAVYRWIHHRARGQSLPYKYYINSKSQRVKDGRRMPGACNVCNLHLAQMCAHITDFLFAWSTLDLAIFIQGTDQLNYKAFFPIKFFNWSYDPTFKLTTFVNTFLTKLFNMQKYVSVVPEW